MGRLSIRIPKYDYTQPGAYFVTICTQNQLPILSRILDGETVFSQEGKIIMQCLDRIPYHFKNSTLDSYVIMPNHIHRILILTKDRRGEASAFDSNGRIALSVADASPLHAKDSQPRGTKKGSLGAIVQNFKSVSTRKINQYHYTSGDRIWQRNYFEHIIRTERTLNAIRLYIMTNPVRWEKDRYNPHTIGIDKEAIALWNFLKGKEISMELEELLWPE